MRILFLILIFSITTVSFAEDYACYDTTSNIINEKYLSVDGAVMGIQMPNNGEMLRTNCLLISRNKILTLDSNTYKYDASIVGTNDQKIRLLNQTEKDAIILAQQQALDQYEASRVTNLDNIISNIDMSGIQLQKVEQAIDNIGSLADAKIFLKKLVRYISTLSNNP